MGVVTSLDQDVRSRAIGGHVMTGVTVLSESLLLCNILHALRGVPTGLNRPGSSDAARWRVYGLKPTERTVQSYIIVKMNDMNAYDVVLS